MSVFGAIARVASNQHGAISRAQLRACGLTDQQLRTWCARGVLVRDQSGVYLVASHPITWEQRLMAVTLAAGPLALASHRSAAGLWRLDRFRRQHLDLTVPDRAPRRSKLAKIHESTALTDLDRTQCDGIPATTTTRTLIDLGRYLSVTRLTALLDDAVRRELTTYGQVHRRFEQLGGRGRGGAATVRRVLANRPAGSRAPDSPLEDLVRRLLVTAGIPEPVLHHRVECDDLTYVLDLAWPEQLVAVECDGFRFHRTPDQLDWDDERRTRLGLRGWLVLHATWRSATSEPATLVRSVRRALERR
jgi:hypothetical protein